MIDRLVAARNAYADEMSRRPKSAGHSWRLLNECGGNLVELREVLEYGDAAPPALFKAAKMAYRLDRAIETIKRKPLLRRYTEVEACNEPRRP